MSTILITGATGLLAGTLVPHVKTTGNTVVTLARSGEVDYRIDLANSEVTNTCLDKIKPDVIINLAGLTNVDLCETQPNLAYLGNVHTVENLANWLMRNKNCHLIHISTDHLYDRQGPHKEDLVYLSNFYAFSKYAGELALSRLPSSILRTTFFGASHTAGRASFSDWIYRALSKGDSIQVFSDVMFSPLSMTTLSEMLVRIIDKKSYGIFNLGSRDGMSKADFAFAFAEELSLPTEKMKRVSTSSANFLKAYRPKDMRMVNEKIESCLGIKTPLLCNEIKLAAGEYRENT